MLVSNFARNEIDDKSRRLTRYKTR